MNEKKFKANEIPIADVLNNYEYDPETGEIFKKLKKSLKKIGFIDSRGYISITHKGIMIKAHRLAYALYYGEWPKNELDHVNRIKTDNRISNIRDANRYVNNQNRVFKKKFSLVRKNYIFEQLLLGTHPSKFDDLDMYFPYSFKNHH